MKNNSFPVICVTAVLLAAAVLSGCTGFAGGGASEKMSIADMPGGPGRAMAREEQMDEPMPEPMGAAHEGETAIALSETLDLQTPRPKQEQRKKVYSGNATLIVDDVDGVKEEISILAEARGGYVEYSFETTVVIRVPAADFENIFSTILGMGDVEFKAIETIDVTDFFYDMQTRLELNTKTRERLYALLGNTKDVEERLKILREIRRLTEEIERIGRSLELLENQIAYSRITIELIPRLPVETEVRQTIPFSWIARLNPLYPTLGDAGERLDMDLGDDFAGFSEMPRFRAESPEGARVRIGGLPNEPKGDEAFWQQALYYHLGPLYRSAEKIVIGPFHGVLFESKDSKPYYYFAGVLLDAKEDKTGRLSVLELFFPDGEAKNKRREIIYEAAEALAEVRDEK